MTSQPQEVDPSLRTIIGSSLLLSQLYFNLFFKLDLLQRGNNNEGNIVLKETNVSNSGAPGIFCQYFGSWIT